MRNAILTILLSMLIIPAMGQERREFYLANRDTTSSVDIVFKKILENTYTLDVDMITAIIFAVEYFVMRNKENN